MQVWTEEHLLQWCVANHIMPTTPVIGDNLQFLMDNGYNHFTGQPEEWFFYTGGTLDSIGSRIYDSDVLYYVYQQMKSKQLRIN